MKLTATKILLLLATTALLTMVLLLNQAKATEATGVCTNPVTREQWAKEANWDVIGKHITKLFLPTEQINSVDDLIEILKEAKTIFLNDETKSAKEKSEHVFSFEETKKILTQTIQLNSLLAEDISNNIKDVSICYMSVTVNVFYMQKFLKEVIGYENATLENVNALYKPNVQETVFMVMPDLKTKGKIKLAIAHLGLFLNEDQKEFDKIFKYPTIKEE